MLNVVLQSLMLLPPAGNNELYSKESTEEFCVDCSVDIVNCEVNWKFFRFVIMCV